MHRYWSHDSHMTITLHAVIIDNTHMLVTGHLHANFYEEVVILYHQGNLLPLFESRHKCSLALVNGCLIRKCAEVISISTKFGV